jgi:hypothetical protein
MIAIWLVDEEAATARDNSDAGTSAGSSAAVVGVWNARADPNIRMVTRITSRLIQPAAVPIANTATDAPVIARLICTINFRS